MHYLNSLNKVQKTTNDERHTKNRRKNNAKHEQRHRYRRIKQASTQRHRKVFTKHKRIYTQTKNKKFGKRRKPEKNDTMLSNRIIFARQVVSVMGRRCSSSCRFLTTTQKQKNQVVSLIINAVGTDRLGIVHDMTKEVIDAGGNVGASQAAKLGKYFSLMMLVDVPINMVDSLTTNLQTQYKDLSASVSKTDNDAIAMSSSYKIGYKGRLTLEGADNPGIVHKVTKILSNNGLNIDTMETSDEAAPHGGTGKLVLLYFILSRVRLPRHVSTSAYIKLNDMYHFVSYHIVS
jgi:glycine cleavage system transcriptional repressor